jgi:DNA-binding CsgD family transcriptional regulator/catechol 2,3-dioxygenase-like lactoylglutathione lyase family enzyme
MGRGRPRHPDRLTPAEWRVVHAVRHGMSNGQIRRRFGVSLDAVKYHVSNAVGKLGLRSRADLRHWAGAPLDSPLHARRKTMTGTTTVALGPIGQISRQVSDIDAAVRWYRDVLGLPHLFTFGNMAFFDCHGVRLYLFAHDKEGDAPGDSVLYFRTDDIDAAFRDMQARGVVFRGAPHLIHRHPSGLEEWMAFFDDPDGKSLALMSQVQR